MLRLIFFYLILFSANVVIAQTTRVAILDFDNISGIAKFDGLGKAMSSMLITDIEANVSPKRVQLVERAQIQKILKEQNFQSSVAVDKSTAVRAGKILGVKYLLVGDIYILDDVLVINARLTDTETGDIKFSKKQEGKVSTWLMLKTNIAKELASSMSMPFTEPNIPDKEINVATITTFGNALVAKDEGKLDKAEELLNTVLDFSPNFSYTSDLFKEIEEIRERLIKVERDVEITTTDPIAAAKNYDDLRNFLDAERYYLIAIKRLSPNQVGLLLNYSSLLTELSYRYGNFEKALKYSENILEVYSLSDEGAAYKSMSLIELNREKEFIDWSRRYLERAGERFSRKVFAFEINRYKVKNGIEFVDIEGYNFSENIEVFSGILGEFSQINSKLNGLQSTLSFLKALNSSLKNDQVVYETLEPYYLPANQFSSNFNKSGDDLVDAKSGEPYVGSFFRTSSDMFWTKESPMACPCFRLFPKFEYERLQVSFIKAAWQTTSFQAEGWYSLLSKEVENARKRFGHLIFYQIQEKAKFGLLYDFIDSAIGDIDALSISSYQGLRDILDREGGIYDGKENLKFLEQLSKSEITLNSDDLVNNILNFGHTYIIEGRIEEALIIYKYFDPNYMLKEYKMTVLETIQNDLAEFELEGIVKTKDTLYILNNIEY